jgi:hypothetical protein
MDTSFRYLSKSFKILPKLHHPKIHKIAYISKHTRHTHTWQYNISFRGGQQQEKTVHSKFILIFFCLFTRKQVNIPKSLKHHHRKDRWAVRQACHVSCTWVITGLYPLQRCKYILKDSPSVGGGGGCISPCYLGENMTREACKSISIEDRKVQIRSERIW